ncbi:hypothetical protein BU108_03805 [Staphylococcus xylosus]|uniref:hypothetical protein n=1 Tax=Staphylococcus xylosus TaxID=1288 RepID=UPI000D1D3B3C|nr:hypothetical protein [Staphylococcus xylosus]PTH92951.1 hypothetical protein BU108_03805 [Staphylococcus xylosus]
MNINLIKDLNIAIGQDLRGQLISNFYAIQKYYNHHQDEFKQHQTTQKNAHQANQISFGQWNLEDEAKYRGAQTSNLVLGAIGDETQELRDSRVSVINEKKSFPTLSERLKHDLLALDNIVKDNEQKVESLQVNKAAQNASYKKEVWKQLPLKFPDYEDIVVLTGNVYIYPQSFALDEQRREIFVNYSGGPTIVDSRRWIAVWDMDTLEYKTVFAAGNAGGEGTVVKYENGIRYLYVKTRNHVLGRFNIDQTPERMAQLEPLKEYDVNVEWQFNYNSGIWYVTTPTASTGAKLTKTVFEMYDDDFERIGTVAFDITDGGFFNTSYANKLPKRQGFAIGNGQVYFNMGGYAKKGDPTYWGYQGIKKFSNNGTLLGEHLISAQGFIDVLEDNGYGCDIIESEGVQVGEDGSVYTITVHQSRHMDSSDKEGIIIFKEESTSPNALDFTRASATTPSMNTSNYANKSFPRSTDGDMYNPLNGDKLDTMVKILDFMSNTDFPRFEFYSSAVEVKDLDGNSFEPTRKIVIENANNLTFVMTLQGNTKAYTHQMFYYWHTTDKVWKNYRIKYGNPSEDLPLAKGVTSFYNMQPYMKILPDGTKIIDGQVEGVSTELPAKVATLPPEYRPRVNKQFICALSSSSYGGYGIVKISATTGDIEVTYTTQAVSYISLSGISYDL